MLDSRSFQSASLGEQPRKNSLFRSMLPFRSKNGSPRNSIDEDSRRSSTNVDYPQDPIQRRFSKPGSSISLSNTSSRTSVSSATHRPPNKLRKNSAITLQNARAKAKQGWERDRVTGERKDPTNMLHTLAHDFDAPGSGKTPVLETNVLALPAYQFTSKLSKQLWHQVFSHITLDEEAALSLSCKSFRNLCQPDIFRQLNHPDNFRSRCNFLYKLDYALPHHLLCYVCGIYHRRSVPGHETLRPTNIANPIFICPYATSNDPTTRIPKHRLTFGRHLPYPFLQLALRHHQHGALYGLPAEDLGRRYKDKPEIGQWFHQTRWAVIDSHLYLRVVSTAFTTPNLPPAGKRHLLYSREDFTPFFSMCAHWRDGDLMNACKCALDHIPIPLSGGGVDRLAKEAIQKMHRPKSQIVTQCDFCKPMRRCPECPTEYLIEIRLQEDRTEKDPTRLFKQAITVTRWTDLGDGSAPWSPEWAAVQGDLDALPDGQRYDSFKTLGRRAISGTFESWFNPEQVPPSRLISLNPGGEKLGERGHNWY